MDVVPNMDVNFVFFQFDKPLFLAILVFLSRDMSLFYFKRNFRFFGASKQDLGSTKMAMHVRYIIKLLHDCHDSTARSRSGITTEMVLVQRK